MTDWQGKGGFTVGDIKVVSYTIPHRRLGSIWIQDQLIKGKCVKLIEGKIL